MISYEGWDREYQENKELYLEVFDKFMSQLNYENNEEFENNFAKRLGRKYAISVANATDALYFSLLSYGIGPGDEVLVTNFSWISSASCVNMTGATPVFCDIDLESYHISLGSVERMVSSKTKAIIYVHLFGNMVDTTEIRNYCIEKNIIFIEDSSQNLGSSFNKELAGTLGDCSVFSFNSNKVIAGINGGGIVLTDNEHQANLIKKIRRHGKDKEFELLGFNSRMYVLNAQIINIRLAKLKEYQTTRQQIAAIYNDEFDSYPVYTQKMSNMLNHNYHKYTLRLPNNTMRTKIKNALNASIHYEKPLSENKVFKLTNYRADVCLNSKLVSDTIVSLPIHSWLTSKEVHSIIKVVKNNF